MREVKKILVVRYRFIGDMILMVPFLRNLRYAYPNAEIEMLVAPNSGEVISQCPYVNKFIYFDTTRKHKYECGDGDKKSFWTYVKQLKKENYDKAYILKRSLSSAALVFLAGIPKRIGFDTEFRGFMLTKRVKYDEKKHESLCALDVLKADNIEVKDTYLENTIMAEEESKIADIIKSYEIPQGRKKVIVHATASNEFKTWDINNFARIIEYLSNKKDVQVFFVGAPQDRAVYENIKYNENLKIEPINLCGKLSIRESLALIKAVDLLVGNDSGNLHMASSVGTTVIGIYGPMPFEKWRALGEKNILFKPNVECAPCSLKKKCTHNKACLQSITPKQVIEAIDTLIPIKK